MSSYYPVQDNIEIVTEIDGSKIIHPKYQCKYCGHSIAEEYYSGTRYHSGTGECGICHEGMNQIGEYLERIYSVSIYMKEMKYVLTDLLRGPVKKGEYVTEMADILQWGFDNFEGLTTPDYIVPPPRGDSSSEVNHMELIAVELAERIQAEVINPLQKASDYPSQKSIDDPKERHKNVKNNIESDTTFQQNPTIVIVDDVIASCGTLKYSAKALIQSGAQEVYGLGIGRSEDNETLVDSEVLERDEDD